MPGGLTRNSTLENSFIISNQLDGISKDTWVLSAEDEKDQPVFLQLNTDVHETKLLKRSLPSHTAENLFWVGRYTERVIYNARLQRTVMQQMLKSNKPVVTADSNTTEAILLQTLTQCTYTFPGFFDDENSANRNDIYANSWKELTDVLYNEKRNGSLSHNIALLKNSVYSVRNFWALDTWRVLRQMEEEWNKATTDTHADHLRMISTIDALNTSMFAFLGMNRESVRREQGWNILDLGRKIEQSLYIITLLKAVFNQKQEELVEYDLLESVMIASQSLITYRYTYRDHLQLPLVLELLLLDNNYPKSLAYLVKKIKRYISLLPKEGKDIPLSDKQRTIQEADSLLKLADVTALAKYDPASKEYASLHHFLDKLYLLISDTSVLISKTYFKHNQTQKQLFTANLI